MEIRQVQSFVHVARLGSFSRAAETMGYSQSAITVRSGFWRKNSARSCLTVWVRKSALRRRGSVS